MTSRSGKSINGYALPTAEPNAARGSNNNDENMLIIKGHRPLAEAYARHMLDIYDHLALLAAQ